MRHVADPHCNLRGSVAAGRRLGQHFLIQGRALERIAEAACPSTEPLAIEIGPGRGALTSKLLERADRVIAIELDRDLVTFLRAKFHDQPRLEIVEGDVLQTDLAQWGPAVIVGNLPYYITSPILHRVFPLGGLISRAVFLVQLEVAERLVAQPGSRDYGFLTVEARLFTEPELLFRLPPGAFQPPPKVDSAVVRLALQPPRAGIEALVLFAGLCFRHKRKTLRNNLAPYYGRDALDAQPESRLRAEQLSPDRLEDLYRRLGPPR